MRDKTDKSACHLQVPSTQLWMSSHCLEMANLGFNSSNPKLLSTLVNLKTLYYFFNLNLLLKQIF